MFDEKFYRFGNALVSTSGVIIQYHADEQNRHFSVHIPHNAQTLLLYKNEFPDEYEQYYALLLSSPRLSIFLHSNANFRK